MQKLIKDLRALGLTLDAIGDKVGMSRGGVHDLLSGRRKTVSYQRGKEIVAFHKAQMRRAAAKTARELKKGCAG